MAQGGDTPDGKTSLCTDQSGIRLALWLSGERSGAGQIILLRTCGNE